VIQKRHLKVIFSGEWWHRIAIDGLSAIERLILVSKIDRWRQYIIAGDHGVEWHFNRLTANSRMLVDADATATNATAATANIAPSPFRPLN